MPDAALDLARALREPGGPMPWSWRSPLLLVAAAVRRFAVAGWTVADVAMAANRRLVDRGAGRLWTPPTRPVRPAAWIRWLLADADPAAPPAQRAAQASAARRTAQRAETEARRAQHKQLVAGAAGLDSPARIAAREVARRAAARTGVNRHRGAQREAAARAALVASRRTPSTALPDGDGPEPDVSTCVGGCHHTGADVQVRHHPYHLPIPRPLCPACWAGIVASM